MPCPDVIAARVTGHLEFSVRFADGVEGRVQLKPSYLYGVFEALKDPTLFSRLSVTDGFVCWSDNIDLAPDAMYEAVRRQGLWVVE